MTWLPILVLALVAFAIAVLALRLPRNGWTMFGAALLFGLAGYALQGNPGQAGAPKPHVEEANETGEAMIAARRALFDPDFQPSRFVVTADAFARRGQFADAAGMLRNAVRENPRDTEAWLGLGNALIEHADGAPTPAALYAYSRAQQASPGHPGAAYFTGLALLRVGRIAETRAIWAELVENAPEDASWLPSMRERLGQLDRMIEGAAAQ